MGKFQLVVEGPLYMAGSNEHYAMLQVSVARDDRHYVEALTV